MRLMSQYSELITLSTQGESKTAVFIFSGNAMSVGRVPPFEFLKTMNAHFSDLDTHIYIDHTRNWYAEGFRGITTSIDDTIEYLKKKVEGYDRVVFMGTSAGGYAAILFGSIMEVDRVVSFIPQTNLDFGNLAHGRPNIEDKYRDILPYVNDTTEYHLYANDTDKEALHHPYHIDRVVELGKENVHRKSIVQDLKYMRDNGMLVALLEDVFYN